MSSRLHARLYRLPARRLRERSHRRTVELYGLCEQCDATALGGATCEGFGGSGTLRCGADCRPDRTSCDDLCRNGRLDPGEACDVHLETWEVLVSDGVSCASLGLGAGTLGCSRTGGGVLTPYGLAVSSA